jgi:hypothetical protein
MPGHFSVEINSVQFDPENPYGVTIIEPFVCGIGGIPTKRDVKGIFVERGQEAGLAGDNRRPGVATHVHRANDDKRKPRIEKAVLFDQMISDETPANISGRLFDTSTFLHRDLAAVPRQWLCFVYLAIHRRGLSLSGRSGQAERPTDVLANGTNPGSVSMRASQAPTWG